jgi:hypothetical protein
VVEGQRVGGLLEVLGAAGGLLGVEARLGEVPPQRLRVAADERATRRAPARWSAR